VIVIPDEIHGFLRFAARLRAESATAEFFDRCSRARRDSDLDRARRVS
jgi:hypothetical protein